MKFEVQNNNVLVYQNKKGLSELFNLFNLKYPKFKANNIILFIDETQTPETDFLSAVLEFTKSHQDNKKSFVVVAPQWSQGDIPEDIVCVPTLQEANDLIEMDEMQRDLGF